MILKIMGWGFLRDTASPSAQGFPRFFRGFPRFFRVSTRFFRGPPRLSWAGGRRCLVLLFRAAQPVFLYAVTQLLRVHTQQCGRTMHTRDPPMGRLQGR